MVPRITKVRLSLVLAVMLAACGGGGETVDGAADAVVDEAATAVDATSEAAAGAADDVADAASEAGDAVVDAADGATDAVADAASDASDAVTDAAGDGWVAMQENWEGSAGLVKDRWAELTEAEILETGGDREQLVDLVQERYELERGAAEAEVEDWAASL